MARWKRQRWMGPSTIEKRRWDTHEEAVRLLNDLGSVVTLTYEEAALIYSRARGLIVDDAIRMTSPLQEAQTND